MTDPAIAVVDLAKSHGRQKVLEGISFEVRAGEYFGLVGVNGAGKTSLLRILVDYCPADRGQVRVFGVDHRAVAVRQRFAFLPERFNPAPFATGDEFLRLLCRLHSVPYEPTCAQALGHDFELGDGALRRRIGEYSKGMVQKLGLIACLLVRRDLLILDEPMSGLDPKARALVKRRLLADRDQGRAMLFTTHLLQDLDPLCDRIAVLHEGRLAFIGTTTEFRTAYDTADLEQAYLASVQ